MGVDFVPTEKPEALTPISDTLVVTGGELVVVVVVLVESMKSGGDN